MRLHKFLLLFLGILGLLSFHFTSTVMAEIDYSGSKEGSFEVKDLKVLESKTLTEVPIGVKDLEINMVGTNDIDIRILDMDVVVDSDATEDVEKYRLIVAHDDQGKNLGYHDKSLEEQIPDSSSTGSDGTGYSKEYKGMAIEYSGYDGSNETIKIGSNGTKNITTAHLKIVATAFTAGEGKVTYNFLDYTPPASGNSMEDAIPITKALTTISLDPNTKKYYKFTPQLSDLIRIYGVVADGQGRDSDISYSFEDDNIQMGSDTSNGVLDIDLSILDYVFEPGKDYYLTFTNNTSDAQTLTLNLETYQLTADDSAIDANGMSSSTVHAKVTGFDGKPVVGKQFRLEAYGGDSVITPESGTTDSSGQIDFHVTDSTFEEVTYSLKDSDDSLYLGSPVSVVFNQRPTAVTEPASAIASTSAVLNGNVDDQGAETTVSFDYGTTMSYGSTAAATTGGTVAAGAGGTPVAVTLQGLMPETTYHYRVIATNSSGTRQGTDQTFTTGAAVTMYAVTYAAGDHGTISSTSESVAQGEHPAGVPAVTPADGYSFAGWSSDGGATLLSGSDVAATTVNGDITYTARYTPISYTVSFNTGGGSEVTAQQVNYNGHATEPVAAPTKEGYTFGGWYTDDAYGTAFDFANTAIKGSTTVYAKWTINSYTVSFNTAGGSEVTARQVNYNGHASEPATAPTKEGYAFGGWYTDDAYGTAFDFTNTAIKGNTTVYAKWIINGYTVSFNTDGGTEVPAQQVNYNGHATQPVTAPTKEGYTFGGWYTDDAYGTAFDFANTAIKGNTTVYAKWIINGYTVSFNTDGGTEVPAQQVNYNGHATQPATAPTKEGYTFGGWYTDDAYGTAFDFANTAIKGSTTVYAKWIINGYTVSFNTDGGTEVPAQQVNYNGHATQPATAPTKEGYTFGGWYTDAAYGTAFDFANMAIKGNTTVYAKWSINQYTVSFNTAGGSEVTAQQINYNGHVTEPATAPTKEGYTFGGWYTDDAYGTAFDFANTAITGTTTVYAKWDINGYTVSFNTGGGSEVTAQQVNYNGHASEPVTAPTKEGYAFSGWYTDDAYGTAFDFTNTAIKNNTTVYAKWTINGYTVSFNTDGGTKVTAQQVNYNGHASEPVTAPTKEGYTFGGWYTDDAYGTAFDFANTAIKGNTTVYAKWTINNYAVSFNTGGGTEVPAQQVNYNGHASEPVTAPTKEGYAFSGWYTDDAYGTAFDFANTAIKGNTTVYAKWTINSYTVSFNTAGGTEVPAQQVNYNGHASEPATAPTKAGYMFAGWYTDSNSNEPFHFTEQAITSNLTLSAKWIMNVPGVPVIQSAAAGDAQVTVTWTQVPGASGYKIYQSTAAGSYANPLTTVSGAVYSYTSSGLKNGTPYYYVVKAINEGGDSAPSNEITATPQVLSPGAPEIVAAQPGNKQVRLNWKPVAGAVGYTVYSGTASGKYGKEAATVSGSVYSYEVTGLTNGTTYYFVVKATNPGGESPVSNEVSATPKSVPSAPTSVTAVAGKGQAVITFTPSDDDGGSPITGYEVAASPGNITVSGTASPITVTGLTNGIAYTFTVKAVNGVGAGTASEPSNAVTPFIPSKGGGGGTSAPSTGSNTSGASTGVDVLVNGKAENAGTATTATVNNQSVTTIAVDPKKLEEKLAAEGQHAVITIPMTAKSDVVVGELNGQMVKNMESSQAVVELKTDSATYTLPAQQINIDAISEQIGKSVPLEAIRIQIEIAKPEASMAQVVENAAAKGEFTIVAPAVQFTVKGTYGDKTIEVSKFNAYVERTIVIPDGVDPKKITTAVVVDPDGTVRHVPTRIVVEDGRYVAKINSLTNSTYSVVWHPLEFKDVAQHWAKDSVNDMGSRMVINGVSDDRFNPDQEITRAEFAAIMVRALGLKPEAGAAPFTDVHNSDWYAGAIQTAYAYQLIGGFEDGTFRPTDSITREQAMTIMSKAMTITELKQKLGSGAAALNTFEDADTVSGWAAKAISDCLQAGLVTGRGDHRLEPQASISRAEVAAIVQRLLQKSGLI
ncbi:Internalin-A precursor [Paenibacillus konkukensis]|uniref:Internalin-A n=2 Tax=Paenibacillus konkukensis TaxID=2020716 RepID=A0ABY4RTG2_9BACL|nr:Internalin-A precursor [Paenibacillus konkukensis]